MYTKNGPSFLSVSIKIVIKPSLITGCKVFNKKGSLEPNPADEGHVLSIGRNLGCGRATGPGRDRRFCTCFKVNPMNGINRAVRVTVILIGFARAHILRIIKVSTVETHVRFACIMLPASTIIYINTTCLLYTSDAADE